MRDNIYTNSHRLFGGTNQHDVDAFNERIRSDRAHARRSQAQRIRRSRERLYGKQSHLVSVRKIGE